MTRKMRTPKARVDELPTPAWTFALLTGAPASVRIAGWVTQAQGGCYGAPDADAVWTQHREALIAEARRHGFEPAQLTRKTPTGRGFEEWRDRFLATHRY
jgi:hypothetical protein